MNIKLANRLVELRKANGLSQEALAEKLGLSRQSISKWERAEASPDTDNLIALAEIYGLTLDQLLGNSEIKEEPKSVEEPSESEKKELTEKQKKGKQKLIKTPLLFLAAVAIYAGGGIVLGPLWWAIAWTIFLCVFGYALSGAALYFENKKPLAILFSTLAGTLLAICLYIVFGIVFGLWAVAWIIFLAIPAYVYVRVIKK